MTTTWTADRIKSELQSGNRPLLVRALLAIYEGQTSDEKSVGTTKYLNGIGFNGFDAEILTNFVHQWETRKWFSDKQYSLLAKKLPKYSGQLLRIAEAKAEAKDPQLVNPHDSCKIYCMDASEIDHTVGDGMVEFEDGTLIEFKKMTPVFQGDELVSWETMVGSDKYVIFND